MVRNNTWKCMPTLCKKMHMDSCMRAYSTVQQLLCHGGYCELILSLARTSCRMLFTARPTARFLAALRDVVRSRNSSKSTLAHDAVATAVLHKHNPIIRVGAGLIQFVFKSHLRFATEATRNRNAFSPFSREFQYMCIFFAVSHGVACILEQVFWALVHMQTYTLNRCLLDIKVHVCDTLAAGCAYVYVHIYIYAHAYIHGYVCASMILLEVLRRRCCTLRVPNKTTTLLLYTQ